MKKVSGISLVRRKSSLEVAIAESHGNQASVIQQEKVEAPKENVTPQWWVDAGRDIWNGRKQQPAFVAVGLPTSGTLNYLVELPLAQGADLGSMMELQVEKLCPLPLDQVIYSYEILKAGPSTQSVLLTIARRSDIEAELRQINDVGWLPSHVDLAVLGIWANVSSRFAGKSGWFVHLNGDEISLLHFQEGVLTCLRGWALEGEDSHWTHVADQISQELQLLTREQEPVYLFDSSGSEASQTFWKSQLERIFGTQPVIETLTKAESASAGLVHRSQEKARLNLIPEVFRDRIEAREKWRTIKVVLQALGLFYGIIIACTLIFYAINAVKIAVLAKQLSGLNPQRAEAETQIERSKNLTHILDNSRSPLKLLQSISASLPSGVIFKEFSYTEGTLAVSGYSPNLSHVETLISNMQNSGLFEKVDLLTAPTSEGGDFRIESKVSAQVNGGIE